MDFSAVQYGDEILGEWYVENETSIFTVLPCVIYVRNLPVKNEWTG